MPVGTRRSSRLKAGEAQSKGDRYDENLPSPRKRVSRTAKKKIHVSEEKVADIPEETLNFDKTDALSPVESKDDVSIKADGGSDVRQPMDTTSVASELVKSEECSSKPHDSEQSMTQKVTNSESDEETDTKEVTVPQEKSVGETMSHGEVIKGVMEVYKQESTLQKRFKGIPKSGRPWKTEQTARFSNMRKDKPLKSSWQLKMAQKAEKLSVRKYQQELEEAKRQAILLKKQRREEHQKKKEENQKKSEVVQVIKNPAKLKRMKKKQLRMIEKRP